MLFERILRPNKMKAGALVFYLLAALPLSVGIIRFHRFSCFKNQILNQQDHSETYK